MNDAAGQLPPGMATALDVVEASLAAAELALGAGAEVDLVPLEDQIRALCVEAAQSDANGRQLASETLSGLLARLSRLEAAVTAFPR